jgi:hypothetical protein
MFQTVSAWKKGSEITLLHCLHALWNDCGAVSEHVQTTVQILKEVQVPSDEIPKLRQFALCVGGADSKLLILAVG